MISCPAKSSAKVVHPMETGVHTSALQLQTSWTVVILMGIMTFKCLAKVVQTMETGVLNIQTPSPPLPCTSSSFPGLKLINWIKANQLGLTLLKAQSSQSEL